MDFIRFYRGYKAGEGVEPLCKCAISNGETAVFSLCGGVLGEELQRITQLWPKLSDEARTAVMLLVTQLANRS